MLGPNIPIENMSHLTSSFPLRTDIVEGEMVFHSTQNSKKRIKLVLLFVIPGSEEVIDPETMLEEGQKPDSLPRIASVRVPKGVSVAKIRSLIRHVESGLQDIFGRSRRLNFVMICDEDSENWRVEFDLPVFGVAYI